MAARVGPFTRLGRALQRFFDGGGELVGVDKVRPGRVRAPRAGGAADGGSGAAPAAQVGNQYFRRTEKDEDDEEGGDVERRWVEHATLDYDSEEIPVEWMSWLRGTRAQMPTPAEQDLLAARRQLVAHKVAELDAARAQAQLEASGPGEREGEGGAEGGPAAPQQSAAERFGGDAATPAKEQHASTGGGGQSFEPDAWIPGQRS